MIPPPPRSPPRKRGVFLWIFLVKGLDRVVGLWYNDLMKTSNTVTPSFTNLTPHIVTVVAGGMTVSFPPSGAVARVKVSSTPLEGWISIPTFGEVEGLPPEVAGVWLVVSGMVRAALPQRQDLLSPADPVRDADGKVIGCGGFHANPRA